MAKKEIRINFNLENENEKELYEFLLSKTSASGYLKDLALDVIRGTGGRISNSESLSQVVDALKNINTTLSNMQINISAPSEADTLTEDAVIDDLKESYIVADDIDF